MRGSFPASGTVCDCAWRRCAFYTKRHSDLDRNCDCGEWSFVFAPFPLPQAAANRSRLQVPRSKVTKRSYTTKIRRSSEPAKAYGREQASGMPTDPLAAAPLKCLRVHLEIDHQMGDLPEVAERSDVVELRLSRRRCVEGDVKVCRSMRLLRRDLVVRRMAFSC